MFRQWRGYWEAGHDLQHQRQALPEVGSVSVTAGVPSAARAKAP